MIAFDLKLKRPAVFAAALFILSCVLLKYELSLLVISGFFLFSVLMAVSVFYGKRSFFFCLLCALIVIYPYVYTHIAESQAKIIVSDSKNENSYYSGVICGVYPRSDSVLLHVKLDGTGLPAAKIALSVGREPFLPDRFGRIEFYGEPVMINEASIESLGIFSSAENYRSDGIYIACLPESCTFTRARDVKDHSPVEKICLHLDSVLEKHFSDFDGTDTYMYVKALAIGDRSLFTDSTEEIFTRSGLFPILCISGLHVLVASVFLERLMELVGIGKKPRSVVELLFLLLFVLITGASGSVVRAAVMRSVTVAARLIRSTSDMISNLAISFLVLCFYNPYLVFDSGVRLSYLATAGIIAAGELMPYLRQSFSQKTSGLFSSLISGFYAQGFTLPILVTIFDGAFLLSPFSNIAASIVFTPLMYLITLISLLSFLPVDFFIAVIAFPARILIKLLELLASAFSRMELFYMPKDSTGFLYIIFIFLFTAHIFALSFCDRQKRMASGIAFALIPSVYMLVLHFFSI